MRAGKHFRVILILPLLVALFSPLLPGLNNRASAATFSIKTGYYIGNGATQSLSGFGFTPELIILKSNGASTASIMKTKDMSGDTVVPLTAAASTTGVTIDSDGFSLSNTAAANGSGTYITYVAMAGSDCTSSGSLCIGTYAGNGSTTRTVTTGFQPSIILKKSSGAVGGHFKTASMPAANSEFFLSTTAITNSSYIGAIGADGYTAGAQDNLSATTYYYAAFKSDSSKISEGAYTGNGADNRDLSVTSYKPNFVFVKNSSSATAGNRRAMLNTPQSYGDFGAYFDTPASASNTIQALNSSGFQVGSSAITNESSANVYWVAIGGAQAAANTSGSYKMNTGSYTGNGSSRSITGLGFKPDVVMIKSNGASYSVLKTSLHQGASSSYTSFNGADITTAITSLDSDGFSIGTDGTVNTSSTDYQWQAFGGAYNPLTNTGSADFAVGAYMGSGIDDKNIDDLPFQPDFVYAKGAAATIGYYRTSELSGDATIKFAASEGPNLIQSLLPSGFQIGSSSDLNTGAGIYRWIAFKAGANFKVGTYAGNAVADREITAPGIRGDLVWIKQNSSQPAVQRPSTLAGDASQYFANTANLTGAIKSITSSGFTLGTSATTNSNTATYRYVLWKAPPTGTLSLDIVDTGGTSVSSPTIAMGTIGFPFGCSSTSGSLGSSSQRIKVSNTTTSPGWTLTIAATDGVSALWKNAGNTQNYDFNDVTSSGCSDGGDADSRAGRMTLDASAGTLSPDVSCANTGITSGSSASFNQGTVDSVTLLTASGSTQTGCLWHLINGGIQQTIPSEQPSGSYNLNLTVTLASS